MLLAGKRRGDFTHKRSGHVLQVLAAADGGIGNFQHVDKTEGKAESKYKGYEENHHALGGDGLRTAAGHAHHAVVVGGKGLGEFVLLTLLEQEQVKGFLHLLLSFVAQELAGLLGVAHHTGVQHALGVLVRLQQHVLGGDEVLDRGDDDGRHGGKLLVQVLDQVVFLGAAFHQAVALEEGRIVLVDDVCDVGLLEAGVGREEFATGVTDIGEDVPGNGNLVVDFRNLLAGLHGELHVHAGGCTEVRHAVAALEVRDAAVHVAQFFLDDAETLGDELVGAGGNEVLVLDPLLIVHVHEHVEHIYGTLGVHVIHGEVDHRGVFVGQGYGEAGQVGAGRAVIPAAAHKKVFLPFTAEVRVGFKDDAAGHRLDGVSESGRNFVLVFMALIAETLEGNLVFFSGNDGEGYSVIVAEVQEVYRDGQAGAVKGALVKTVSGREETAIEGIVGFQMQAFHYLRHHVRRGETDDFVAHVHAGHTQCHVGKVGRDVSDGAVLLGVFLDEDGRLTGVHRRSLEDIDRGNEKAQEDGAHKPRPAGHAHGPEFTDGEDLLFLLETIVVLLGHILFGK